LRELLWRCAVVGGTRVTSDDERGALQRAFDSYVAACAGQERGLESKLETHHVITSSRPSDAHTSGESLPTIAACLWVDETIVVQRRVDLVWIAPDDTITQTRFQGATIGWIEAQGDRCVALTDTGLAVYEFARGRWLHSVPADVPRWIFHEALERSYLQDVRGRAHVLLDVVDTPVICAASPDARLLWTEDRAHTGGVFDTETGELVGAPPPPSSRWASDVPILERDGTLRAPSGTSTEHRATREFQSAARAPFELTDERPLETPGSALVLTAASRFWFVRAGVLINPYSARKITIGWAHALVAFDRAGERLAVVDDDRVIVLELASLRVLRTIRLPTPVHAVH
jgi:hypothetical protein